MIFRTYLSKYCTIVKGCDINTGLNPVSELLYGKNTSRALIYFDEKQIKKLIDDGWCPDMSKMKHILRITNATSLDFGELHSCYTSSVDESLKVRASSFDLIFFLVPKTWDRGKGYDYSRTFLGNDYYDSVKENGNKIISTDGCNWYQARNGMKWDEEGIYSNQTLSLEYDNFSSEQGSKIIIARQRFDIGCENIHVDITDIVNKFITGELKNYGIGIAFTPALERLGESKNALVSQVENYAGFFTDKTNLFYEPFVETIYDDTILDDRSNFVLSKNNRLYLYSNIGGKPTDLDELPTCVIKNDNDEVIFDSLEVKRQFKGVYYVELSLDHSTTDENVMFYDVWSNIKYQGNALPDVELDFVTKPVHNWFNIDNTMHDEPEYTPLVSGIDSNEKIYRKGEIRKIKVTANPVYSQNKGVLVDEMYYRLYVMDGEREITVIPFEKIHMSYNENFFYLNLDMLPPQKYYIDIRFKYNGEVRTYKDKIHFTIVSSFNNRFI